MWQYCQPHFPLPPFTHTRTDTLPPPPSFSRARGRKINTQKKKGKKKKRTFRIDMFSKELNPCWQYGSATPAPPRHNRCLPFPSSSNTLYIKRMSTTHTTQPPRQFRASLLLHSKPTCMPPSYSSPNKPSLPLFRFAIRSQPLLPSPEHSLVH